MNIKKEKNRFKNLSKITCIFITVVVPLLFLCLQFIGITSCLFSTLILGISS